MFCRIASTRIAVRVTWRGRKCVASTPMISHQNSNAPNRKLVCSTKCSPPLLIAASYSVGMCQIQIELTNSVSATGG